MRKVTLSILLGALALAIVGCGDPAPSTPIAPDIPAGSASASGPTDPGAAKEAEHAGAPTDRG
ncbi:hypothetical protein EON82_16665 [bacterium]|nr:MAG: hypothetical protein EON82_16665 [bacterium]